MDTVSGHTTASTDTSARTVESTRIHGRAHHREGAETLATFDPSTGVEIGQLAVADEATVARAVADARAAFDGPWRATDPAERGRVLARAAALLRERRTEIEDLDVRDGGLPRRMARSDLENAIRYFEYFAGAADKVHGETIPLGTGVVDFTLREPYGACAVITPFNVPVQMAARSLAPALATGNTVVLKPAEQSSLPVLALAAVLDEAGLPPGALNVVLGDGPRTGAPLAGHPEIDHVTFTGSLTAGRAVATAAVGTMAAVTIEAGGKSPQIVFDDADLGLALQAIVGSAFLTAGQVCSAGTRILVQQGVYDRVRDELVTRARSLRLGLAADDPDVGPLISARQQRSVLDRLETVAADGGTVLTGGRAPSDPALAGGFFVEPTVIEGLPAAATVMREEVFGPIVTLASFGSAQEAVRLANDSEFGLVAGIWTRDLGRGLGVARDVCAGQIFVNNYGVGGGVELPFGGFKRSGIGREKGLAALLEYTQIKNVCVAVSP